ncbi:acetyl-CoA carboxylase biotin carboxyl carrier protein [Yinghuangia soli]|uniref:Biotin carboxyl carrier protein of acetyl-CoA carboxylase n=1 Tax=Yinghuangia soli TaxID=2908204 RepID=A0AA41Q6H5_9ACTN|nr:biotin/lipoyl-containing protein [Yinghuangia soli]MCF2531072.1 acetyl-CoA carboxylase, biotin carboxyl carrier protein [Yinghuangia soli]
MAIQDAEQAAAASPATYEDAHTTTAGQGEPATGTAPGRRAAEAAAAAEPAVGSAPSPRHFRMQTGDTVIEIEWGAGEVSLVRVAAAEAPAEPPAADTETTAAPGVFVRSPMVGTFYHAPDPGARPFVGVGDIVQPGQTVGILEAMKMMSPITSAVAGRVVEMLVGDAQPVEYDEPLIALDPLGRG